MALRPVTLRVLYVVPAFPLSVAHRVSVLKRSLEQWSSAIPLKFLELAFTVNFLTVSFEPPAGSAEHHMQQYTTCTPEDGHIDVRNM